jgi:putative serine protease PepD
MPLEDDDDERPDFRPPLPPADRVWRHPSEVALAGRAARGRGNRFGIGVVVLAAVTGAAATVGILAATGNLTGHDNSPAQATTAPAAVLPSSEITGRTRSSIAEVEVSGASQSWNASAVVLRSDGYLLTSARSVNGATALRIVLPDRRDLPAKLTGSDPVSGLAVLHVNAGDLTTPAFGATHDVHVGDAAFAVGADTELDQGSVIGGVVSGLDRRVDAGGNTLQGLIGTDRSLPPSADGGALINASGKVVGICLWADDMASDPWVGYAVPIDLAQRVGADLVQYGYARYAQLGVRGGDLSPDEAASLGVTGGARVMQVMPSTPAANAGLQSSDVITELDGQPVTSMSALIVGLRDRQPGTTVQLSVLRNGMTRTLTVRLAEQRGGG